MRRETRKTRETTSPRRSPRSPQQIVKDAADRYFAALASEIPCDGAPGDVSLNDQYTALYAAIEQADLREHPDRHTKDHMWVEHYAATAGYLLGVEIGRRLGGAR